MPSLTTALTVGTAALLALPLLLLAAPGASPGCAGLADLTPSAAASPDADQPALDSAAAGQDPMAVPTTRTPASAPVGASAQATASQRGWDTEQRAVAATIIAVGRSRSMPPRAIVVALATAMQESQLRNLPGGDADSIGVFQQRPSAGWGTPTQLASPAYQATAFYTALSAVPGWQTMPLTQAAQAVQRSARPDAYARWAGPALTLYQQQLTTQSAATVNGPPLVGDGVGGASGAGCGLPGGDGLPEDPQASLPPGFTLPPGAPAVVTTAVTWALAQLGTPYSYGGDCTAPHSGDPTRACDCSSLTQMAFKSAGLSLPRTTSEQARVGVPVPDLATIQAGDLIFISGSDGTAFSGSPGCEIKIDPGVCPAQVAVPGPSVSAAGVVDVGLSRWQKCAAARVILFAASQLGKPYEWGAAGPGAFDCSGLSMMAYRSAGIAVPRTSQQQWAAGPHVPPGRERPGDLVYFAGADGTAAAPGHVGVVLGGGLMIDAPYTGAPVRIDRIAGEVGFTRPAAGR